MSSLDGHVVTSDACSYCSSTGIRTSQVPHVRLDRTTCFLPQNQFLLLISEILEARDATSPRLQPCIGLCGTVLWHDYANSAASREETERVDNTCSAHSGNRRSDEQVPVCRAGPGRATSALSFGLQHFVDSYVCEGLFRKSSIF